MSFKLISFFLIINFLMIHSWPSGAPEKVCESLTPSHGSNQAKSASLSPFIITQSRSSYQPEEQIKVIVQAPDGISFRGLIIQAYDPTNNQPIGSFQAGRGLKTIDSCSSVTHTDRKGKKSATLIWEAPEGIVQPGQVSFRGTIVQRFNDFYTGLDTNLNNK